MLRRVANPSNSSELIQALIWAGAQASRSGLIIGSGGNLSARLPGADECVVTAGGTWLDDLTEDDFSIVRLDGTVVGGNPQPSSEVKLHLASYCARTDVNAVVHLHPQMSVLLDALGHEIRLLSIDHVFYVRQVVSTPWIASGTDELADAGAEALARADVVILGNHGCSIVADNIELAYKRASNLEEAATATYRALTLGDATTECPPAYRELLEGRASDPLLVDRH